MIKALINSRLFFCITNFIIDIFNSKRIYNLVKYDFKLESIHILSSVGLP